MRLLTCLTLGMVLADPALAQYEYPDLGSGQPPTEVMILGVFHFHNPGADEARFTGVDVMTPGHQAEIRAIVDGLARFEPTKILLEQRLPEADRIQIEYDAYRRGEFELTSNERHQLGYRLAARLGHAELYPVDYSMGLRFDSLMAYASEHDPEYIGWFRGFIAQIEDLFNRMQANESIQYNLRFMNDPASIRYGHEPYVVQAALGAGDSYVGAQVIADWYERNLAIFANMAEQAEPDGRLLLIIGAGHIPILRHLVQNHPDMVLVESVDFLPE